MAEQPGHSLPDSGSVRRFAGLKSRVEAAPLRGRLFLANDWASRGVAKRTMHQTAVISAKGIISGAFVTELQERAIRPQRLAAPLRHAHAELERPLSAEVRTQTTALLTRLDRDIALLENEGQRLESLPTLQFAELPDGSLSLEWIKPDRRLAFAIEPDAASSTWFYLSLAGHRLHGPLTNASLREVLERFAGDGE